MSTSVDSYLTLLICDQLSFTHFSKEISEVAAGKAIEAHDVTNVQRIRNFEDMGLKVELHQGISDYGWVYL
jgi:hypothetical protein